MTVLKLHCIIMIIFLMGCGERNYPEHMTNAKRKAYYKKFNTSRTEEEWEAIRAQRAWEKKHTKDELLEKNKQKDVEGAISFNIKNNSILPARLRIADNVLVFNPLEKRYFGFKPDTKVYLIQRGKEDKCLFTLTENEDGRELNMYK